jgi:AraC-like DNA-binding protein
VRAFFEQVAVPPGASWSLLDRRLDEGIPFQWHYHPEFELTLTLNSRGQRYIGDSIASYEDGDLVLLGPNLPHTWYSTDKIAEGGPHHAVVMWFTEAWAAHVTILAEMSAVAPMLARAARGIAFSRNATDDVRPIIEAIPGTEPSRRLFLLMDALMLLATDAAAVPIAGSAAARSQLKSPDRSRVQRVLDHIHANYRRQIPKAELADLAALSMSGFHRLFQRHTRLTVSGYIAELRIGEACALLVNSQKPIAHIADEVGYPNLANFNRQFRAIKAVTPRDFRKHFAR